MAAWVAWEGPPLGAVQDPSALRNVLSFGPLRTNPWANVEKSRSVLSSGLARSSSFRVSAPALLWAD